jgi:hypothetical protein
VANSNATATGVVFWNSESFASEASNSGSSGTMLSDLDCVLSTMGLSSGEVISKLGCWTFDSVRLCALVLLVTGTGLRMIDVLLLIDNGGLFWASELAGDDVVEGTGPVESMIGRDCAP